MHEKHVLHQTWVSIVRLGMGRVEIMLEGDRDKIEEPHTRKNYDDYVKYVDIVND